MLKVGDYTKWIFRSSGETPVYKITSIRKNRITVYSFDYDDNIRFAIFDEKVLVPADILDAARHHKLSAIDVAKHRIENV